MSAEQNIKDNTSNKEVLSDKSKTVVGDVYVQDVHKYFGVTKALNGVNFSANFDEIKAILNEDCDRNSTGWDNPGMDKWAPRSYVETFFDNPSDPEKYDPKSH